MPWLLLPDARYCCRDPVAEPRIRVCLMHRPRRHCREAKGEQITAEKTQSDGHRTVTVK